MWSMWSWVFRVSRVSPINYFRCILYLYLSFIHSTFFIIESFAGEVVSGRQKEFHALAAWHSGHRGRLRNRRSRVRTPQGCKALQVIAVLLSKLKLHCHCVSWRKINASKTFWSPTTLSFFIIYSMVYICTVLHKA
jgi:hypothetical protein